MSLQWYKFYGSEYLSDPKISSMTPQERSCWITLLCLASTSSQPGLVEYLTIESLLDMSGIKWDPYNTTEYDSAKSVLSKLERMKMIKTNDIGTIEVLNWEKRQESFLTGAERAAKYRAKKKTVAPRNTLRDKSSTRIDKNRIEYKNTDIMSSNEDAFNQFWIAYPKKELKKKSLEIWKRKKLDLSLGVILDFIIAAQKTDRWKKGYIKQPPAFLNGECWNDDVETYNDKVGSHGKSVAIIN